MFGCILVVNYSFSYSNPLQREFRQLLYCLLIVLAKSTSTSTATSMTTCSRFEYYLETSCVTRNSLLTIRMSHEDFSEGAPNYSTLKSCTEEPRTSRKSLLTFQTTETGLQCTIFWYWLAGILHRTRKEPSMFRVTWELSSVRCVWHMQPLSNI